MTTGIHCLHYLSSETHPISDKIPSPAELLFKRKISGILPRQSDFFNYSLEIKEHLKLRQDIKKKNIMIGIPNF